MKVIELDDTLDQIKDDPERYLELFFENKVLVFKNLGPDAMLEFSQAITLHRPATEAGAKQGTNPDGSVLGEYSHLVVGEDHKVRFEQFWTGVGTGGEEPDNSPRVYTAQDEEGDFFEMDPVRSTFMFWHLEDAYKEFPPTAIIMAMKTFTAPEGTGGSGFVDPLVMPW